MSAVARPITERDLREQIRTLCKVYGWRLAFTQYSVRSPKGFPDLVMVRGNRIIFAELKSARGKLTPEQDAWLVDLHVLANALHDHAVPKGSLEVFVWRPEDIERIADVLR